MRFGISYYVSSIYDVRTEGESEYDQRKIVIHVLSIVRVAVILYLLQFNNTTEQVLQSHVITQIHQLIFSLKSDAGLSLSILRASTTASSSSR